MYTPFDGVAQVEFRARYHSVPVENVIHVYTPDGGPIPPSDLSLIAATAAQGWFDEILPLLSNSYVATEVFVRDLTIQNGNIATDTTIAGSVGGRVGNGLPGNIAFCVSLRTGVAGRSFRGRMYLVGLDEADVTQNVLSGAVATSLVAGVDNLRGVLASINYFLCIASRFSNGVQRTVGVFTPVTNVLAVDNRVDTQRRRLD